MSKSKSKYKRLCNDEIAFHALRRPLRNLLNVMSLQLGKNSSYFGPTKSWTKMRDLIANAQLLVSDGTYEEAFIAFWKCSAHYEKTVDAGLPDRLRYSAHGSYDCIVRLPALRPTRAELMI